MTKSTKIFDLEDRTAKFGTKILTLVNAKKAKKISFFLGIIFLILTLFITLDPQPLLRFGYFGVFIFNLFGPGTILIPTLSRFMNIPILSAAAASGMMINDSVAWLVGNRGQMFIGKPQKLASIEKTIQKFGLWALFFWSLIPIPYDFIAFVAGYLSIPYPKYILPTFLGKFVRFMLIGYGFITILN